MTQMSTQPSPSRIDHSFGKGLKSYQGNSNARHQPEQPDMRSRRSLNDGQGNTTKVLAAAQDVGGANALVPVIRELQGWRHARVRVIASGKAARVFSDADIEHETFEVARMPSVECYERFIEVLGEIAPEVLVVGTAWGPSVAKYLLRAAQSLDTPSIAVVDMWSHYKERFIDPVTGELCLPTLVGVMDRLAFEQAVEAGLPESSLVVVGQPHLEELASVLHGDDLLSEARVLRRSWLGEFAQAEAIRLVLFASEAFSRDFGSVGPYYRGYTEVDALEGLVRATRILERRSQFRTKIIVKLHPEESADKLRIGQTALESDLLLVADQPAWPCMLAADVVVGMTSMFLLEAAVAGKPTVSFQPGCLDKDSFVGTRSGMIPAVSSENELASILAGFMSLKGRSAGGSRPRVPQALRTGSARRIAELIDRLATCRSHQAPRDAV